MVVGADLGLSMGHWAESLTQGELRGVASRSSDIHANMARVKTFNASWPLEIPEIIELVVHGVGKPDQATLQIRTHGFIASTYDDAFFKYTSIDIGAHPDSLGGLMVGYDNAWVNRLQHSMDHIVAHRARVPNIEEALALYNRGNIDQDMLKWCMHKEGVRDDGTFQLLASMRHDMLGASDLIRLAVRDAFYPDIVAEYGEANEYPKILDKYMSWVGLGWDTGYPAPQSVDAEGNVIAAHGASWGELLWYAHWEFPSATQGYDMMHMLYDKSIFGPSPYVLDANGRIDKDKVFGDADLNRLLRASGYSTFWRNKITAIADPPLSRVDVRRMHSAGVISDADVYHNYRAQGYGDANAQRLAKYTVIKERPDISKQVCSLYQLGFLDEQGAIKAMSDQGMAVDVAKGHIYQCRLEQQIKVSGDIIKRVHEGYLKGVLDEPESRGALNQLGVIQPQIDYFLAQWTAERLFDHKVPVRTELLQWYADGMLSRDDAISRLQKLSYSDVDISYYMTQQDARNSKKRLAEEAKQEKEQLRVSQSQIKAAEQEGKKVTQRLKQSQEEFKKRAKEEQATAKQAKAEAKAATASAKASIAASIKGIDDKRLRAWYVAQELSKGQLGAYLGLLGWSADAIALYVEELDREIAKGIVTSGPGKTPTVAEE